MLLTENLRFIQKTYPEIPWASHFENWSLILGEQEAMLPQELLLLATLTHVSVDHLLQKDLAAIFARKSATKPRLILLDVDGTLTDGGLYFSEKGDEIKRFHAKDSLIIFRLVKRQGVSFGFISSSFSGNILRSFASNLGVDRLYHGSRPKAGVIQEWLDELSIAWSDIAYVGDDLNDLEVIRRAGISACPADAVERVRSAVDVVLNHTGGQGCVREFLEEVLGFEV